MGRNKFSEATNWLNKLKAEAKFFHTDTRPTLEITNLLLDALGRPDASFQYRVIVGGTAGKGTVCRLTEDILVGKGKKVTTFFSPHVQVITERIRINGKLISPEMFGEYVLRIREIAEKIQKFPTYYEAIILAGILFAKEQGIEVLICEVGCGGEWDAVNAVKGKRISAITFIGDDHREILGGTLEGIAETKSGIFTSNSVLNISGEKHFQKILEKKGPVKFIKGIPSKLNKKIAREICENILETSDFEMQKVRIPARWEKLENVILDGAHSAPRFEYILPKIKKISGKKIGVFALAKNHDAQTFRIIADQFDEIIWTQVEMDRAFWNPSELQEKIGKGSVIEDTFEAFHEAQKYEGTIFVLGSFFLCGVIRNQFYVPEKIVQQRTEFPI